MHYYKVRKEISTTDKIHVEIDHFATKLTHDTTQNYQPTNPNRFVN